MGKGHSQRRREVNFLRAKQAKSGALPLPPPPEEIIRKGGRKRKRGSDAFPDAPRSFQKMMQLKEVSLRGTKKQRQDLQGASEIPSVSGAAPISNYMGSAEALSDRQERAMRPTKEESKDTEAVFPKKAMKDRKKRFLKEKKQRKRGKGMTGEVDDEDQAAEDRERKIMTDTTRPAFGEQAQQPIKVNLKRKHWKESADKKPKDRLQQVFKRQMAQAELRTKSAAIPQAQQKYLVDAYRELKSSGKQGAPATVSSLAALVRRNEEMEAARPS